jgi:hypothetical protein
MKLPQPQIDELMVERVRRRAQAALAKEKQLIAHPIRRSIGRALWRVEPIFVAAACIVYLVWAMEFAGRIYR